MMTEQHELIKAAEEIDSQSKTAPEETTGQAQNFDGLKDERQRQLEGMLKMGTRIIDAYFGTREVWAMQDGEAKKIAIPLEEILPIELDLLEGMPLMVLVFEVFMYYDDRSKKMAIIAKEILKQQKEEELKKNVLQGQQS